MLWRAVELHTKTPSRVATQTWKHAYECTLWRKSWQRLWVKGRRRFAMWWGCTASALWRRNNHIERKTSPCPQVKSSYCPKPQSSACNAFYYAMSLQCTGHSRK